MIGERGQCGVGVLRKEREKISGEGFLQTQTTAYPKTRDGEYRFTSSPVTSVLLEAPP